MKRIFSIICLIAILTGGNTGKINGKITDNTTGTPLIGVNVMLVGTAIGTASDLDGNYLILNIAPDVYEIEAKMIGYATLVTKEVKVTADLTTTIDIKLTSAALPGQVVEVVASKPAVRMDQTSSTQTYSGGELLNLPVENVESAVTLAAGAVEQNGVLHFRGGRAQETVYLFDGIALKDPLTGNANDSNVPMLGVGEMSIITGGFSAEYGDAQSGVINLSSSEGRNAFQANTRLTTSQFINNTLNGSDPENQEIYEFSLSGPIIKDRMYFSFSGELNEDNGRFRNQYNDLVNFSGKLTFNPVQNLKLSVSGLYSKANLEEGYSHLWSKIISEDQLWDFSPDNPANDPTFHSWYGNGQLDTEDSNFNGILDPGEDINSDELLQTEDIDRNANLTTYSMFDRRPWFQTHSDLINTGLTYTFSSSTYLTVQFATYQTDNTLNIIERLNEDVNYNGLLDPGEDLNGNGILDAYTPNVSIHGYDDSQDMFHDRNNNDYVDESEGTFDNNNDGVIDENDWLSWKDIPSEGQIVKDFYSVSPGHPYTFNRDHWHYDKKITNTFKMEFVSQIDLHNKINSGVEIKYYNLTNHDAPDRYGYAENYTVKPTDWGVFANNKMEYKGIIVNAGLRAEYFDPTESTPADETDPLWDESDEDDWDGDGNIEPFNSSHLAAGMYIHQPGDIKNPVSAQSKFVFSPRIGISHPMTDHSKLYFNYGRYYQRPRLDYLFRNLGYNLGGGFPIIGNPALNPELTVSYEVGVQNEIRRNVLVEFKGFFKDIYGLTDTRPIYWTVSDWYTSYENRDYGNVRGIEMIFSVRPPGLVFGSVNYTYSIAKGKSSSVGQGYLTEWAGGIVPTFESYLDWDQTHTFNTDLNVAYQNFLATFIMTGGSGTRYTKPGQGRLQVENTERLPFTLNSDIKLNYSIKLGRVNTNFFITVTNIFDRKNIRYVDDVEWYHQYKTINKSYKNGDLTTEEYMSSVDLDQDGTVDKNKKYPEMGKNLNPAVYSDSRRFRIGVTFDL